MSRSNKSLRAVRLTDGSLGGSNPAPPLRDGIGDRHRVGRGYRCFGFVVGNSISDKASQSGAAREPVIASEANQSTARTTVTMDCFVAALLAMTSGPASG